MEEVFKFLRLVKSHKYTLIIIPIISIIVTYFLVKNLPDAYLSKAQIATGIVDETQQVSIGEETAASWQQVNQEFSNLVEMMRTKKMLDLVSYQLILHDLSGNKPFTQLSKDLEHLSAKRKQQVIAIFKNKYETKEGLNLWNSEQNSLYNMLRSVGYDSESLSNKLRINRAGDSDFINVEFSSGNPELSAFVVNVLCNEFINYYSSLVKANQLKATSFLRDLLAQKKTNLDRKVDSLRNYKIRNRVLNLDEQSSQLYAQIIEFNNRKQEVLKSVASNTGALNSIDAKFEPGERKYLDATLSRFNQRIISTREELRQLYDAYIQNDFDEQYKNSIDSLQSVLASRIASANDQYINNPLAAKQELVSQKLNLEIQLDLARFSLGSIERELVNLNSQFDELVPHEAEVQSMERDVEVASQDYLNILNKYNQSSMESGFSTKLNLVQTAMPGLAQPSKKMLLVILSGLISFVFCLVVIFVLYFLDNSVRSSKDLASQSNFAVLGELNEIKRSSLTDLNAMWNYSGTDHVLKAFKEQLRAIRFEIDKEMDGKVLAITSLTPGAGKTLLCLSLAYAWRMTNKRILLIDGNFNRPEITRDLKPAVFLEDVFRDKFDFDLLKENRSVFIIGTRGGDTSVLEIADEKAINEKLNRLKEYFDLIIVEIPPLNEVSEAKEWIEFSNNTIAVFEYGQKISDLQKLQIKQIGEGKSRFSGWILNKLSTR